MSANIEISTTRTQKIAQAVLERIFEAGVRGDAPTTELFVALLTASAMLAIEARPDVPTVKTCETLLTITHEFFTDVGSGRLKLAMREKNNGR